MPEQIAAGEEFSRGCSPSWFVASCRHRSVHEIKIRALLCVRKFLAGAPAWVRSGDPHFSISGLLRIGHSAANNNSAPPMPVGTLARTANVRRNPEPGVGLSRRIGGGVASCQTTCRRKHWVLFTSSHLARGSMRRRWAISQVAEPWPGRWACRIAQRQRVAVTVSPAGPGPRILVSEATVRWKTPRGRAGQRERPWMRLRRRMARGASGFWLRAGSRLGLACRGTVYLLVGYLAFRLALATHGRAGAPASSAGAVQAAVAPAWGRVPLVLLVAGLAAYALTQLVEAVFRPAHATGTMGRWRQRAVSSWGFLLYSVFCLSTARLLAETPLEQTAQSEQRQDTGMTADLLRTGWGQAAARPGRDPCRGGRPGGGPAGGPAQLPGAVHRRAHVPGAGHGHAGPWRVRLRRARCGICPGRCLPGQGCGAVQRGARRKAWTRSSVRWPAPLTARGCWRCSPPACSATAFTACSRPGTAT